ncbi:MAG: hypothetical protein ABEI97_00580 [Candidatus Nanohaloarchaea archaeon]
MDQLDDRAEAILDIYGRELDDDGSFHHAVEELAKHPPKLAKLYEQGEAGHLKEEVVDVLLLAHVLKLHADIDAEDISDAADHFIDKIDSIYTG